MNNDKYRIVPNGDSAITILFNDDISEHLTKRIIGFSLTIKQSLGEALIDIIPAYKSLTIFFNNRIILLDKLIGEIELLLSSPLTEVSYQSKTIEIPVCYEEGYGPDLTSLAQHCKLSVEDVIAGHTQRSYLVHMLGFLPGFLYLGGLSTNLSCPRKSTPAISIPAGSVAIGDSQTGIYPVSSPGGWHIIGRTPLTLFNPNSQTPFIASPLDKIHFVSISKTEFTAIKKSF
ncbi:5-oxoprolinase subunit PxpB [Pseudoalteromonas sp. NBT06-2]|uniref:5-oxoprolinase subunit PxpB n=1 Tax=Pseudoalteromonas sp. NBT06-2 TaxID=2025950 RepID=UPI001483CA78|nr:5-oxoprolinase subunit PxpB [Pseudoalteromonas sp. NBT06-2]